MKRIIHSIFLCFLNSFLIAQIPAGYYNSAAGLTGAPLQMALHNIIKNHNSVSYASLWTHFQTTDKKTNAKVWDIYSDVPSGTPPYEFTFGTNQCGNYSTEGDCYNREHSWPQSWFSSATIPSSDMFHIYPTDGYVNNKRSNYPYGTVASPAWTSLNGSKLGFSADLGYSGAVFEPIDEYKGDLARSYFYMATRYLTEDGSWSTSAATNKATILPWQVDVLLQWSHQDTVSAKEKARNNAIYGIQNNRNPFIDNPQWADSIWTATVTGFEAQLANSLALDIYPNPSSNIFYISNQGKKNVNVTIRIINELGQVVESRDAIELSGLNSSQYIINCENWNRGIYYITILEKQNVKTLKFVKI